MPSNLPWLRIAALVTVATATILQTSCGGSDSPAPTPTALACDDGIKTAFKPDANTAVLLVKAFKQGDLVALSGTPASPAPQTAPADLCLVKLLVGPGNAGPAGAPSTSAGIGIEVWLPTADKWNERIRAYGSGGWAGSAQADITQIGGGGDGNDLHVAAAGKGTSSRPPTMGMRPCPDSPGL
jgi:hypothetical protein